MKRDRLPEILKGLFLCAAIAVGVVALLYAGVAALFFVTGLLLSPLLSQMPH